MKAAKWVVALCLCVGLCPSLWADDFYEAKTKAENFTSMYEKVRSLEPQELRRLVKELCGHEEESESSLFNDVRDRVARDVSEKLDELKRSYEEAVRALDKDETFNAAQKSEARSIKERIGELWGRVERMDRSGIRAGNHPIVAFMRKAGQDAHPEYQSHSEYCTEHEVETGDGKADCVYADKCWVIELKPNNDKAVDLGRKEARDYTAALNEDKYGKFTELTSKREAFKSCKAKFEPKVVTYAMCPEVSDDGEFRSTSYGFSNPED